MTHDELLTRVSVNQSFLEEKEQFILAKAMSALRAVVELHKPSDGQCYECHYEGRNYPCETIQAIEEQLS